jgi:hypothetical protein
MMVKDRVKVKLSLCLTKYHNMKTYPALNRAPCHEDVWWNGGTAPCILNLGTRGGELSASRSSHLLLDKVFLEPTG